MEESRNGMFGGAVIAFFGTKAGKLDILGCKEVWRQPAGAVDEQELENHLRWLLNNKTRT